MTPPPATDTHNVDHSVGSTVRGADLTRSSTVDAAAITAPSPSLLLGSTVLALLVLFGILAAASMWRHGPLAGDQHLAARLLEQRGTTTWRFADATSFVASGPVVAMIAFAAAAWLAIARRRLAVALAVLAAPAVAGAIEIVAKIVVDRPRPLTAALTGESGNGFPSGHVTGFTALTVVLLAAFVVSVGQSSRSLRVVWSIVAALAIISVMWSRVALGAHYPSDVVGGALLGAAIGLLAVPAARRSATVAAHLRHHRSARMSERAEQLDAG